MPYSESVYPITLVETLKPISTIILCFGLFCLLYIHINNNKFTNGKFKTAKFRFSILDMF